MNCGIRVEMESGTDQVKDIDMISMDLDVVLLSGPKRQKKSFVNCKYFILVTSRPFY